MALAEIKPIGKENFLSNYRSQITENFDNSSN
jgi:hypothetical protein